MKLNNQNQKKLLYVVKGINGCCISPLEEWIKWLLYPNERSASHKNIENMSLEELKEYKEQFEQVKMAELFFKYQNKECTELEHDLVYHYMINHSIEELMESKMNEKELNQAKILLAELKNLSSLEIKNYIQEKNSDYNNLSKIDAYVLHYISIFNYNKASTETTKKIIQQNKEKEVKLRKSLHKDYGYFS